MTRKPTEMELRVARIIAQKIYSSELWDDLSIKESNFRALAYIDVARAAIRVMAEPTEAMTDAYMAIPHKQGRRRYQAMIDAASPEDAG